MLRDRAVTVQTSELQCYRALVCQPIRPMHHTHQRARPGLFPTQYSVTGHIRKGLRSSQVASYPSYHNVLILCSLPMSFKGLLLWTR